MPDRSPLKWLGEQHVQALLKSPKGRFAAKGYVVLRGCNTADGPAGKKPIAAMTRLLGVPVKASDWTKIVGKPKLVGNIPTARPDGKIEEDGWTGALNVLDLPIEDRSWCWGRNIGAGYSDTEARSRLVGEIAPRFVMLLR